MFSYFGSKSKIVKYYPKPKYDTIIEPFAGSARYALLYSDRHIILVEKAKRIADIWRFLITASDIDIDSLPHIPPHGDIRDYNFSCQGARDFTFACHSRGSGTFGNKVGKWCTFNKAQIKENCAKIRHWQIIEGDYTYAPDIKATWFIDPPYEKMGYRYMEYKLSYPDLLLWSQSRQGQVIVCENTDATWLPITIPVKSQRGCKHTKTEVMALYGD